MSVLSLDGAAIHYDVAGRGPDVVLVHGFGLDMRMWQPQVEALAANFRVLRYDCRGFGSSGMLDPAVPYTHVQDLLALLEHVGIARTSIIGLSFGGQVALRAALAAPHQVRALVLLDAVLDGIGWDAVSAAGLTEVARQVDAGGVAAGRRAWLAHPLFKAARNRPDVAARLAIMVDDYPGQHWLGLDPHQPEPSPLNALGSLDLPCLVVVGADDVPCFVEMAEVLATRIPGATYRLVPDAGHMVNLEQPEVINSLIQEFLAEHHLG